MKKLTLKEFISKANRIHNNKYKYKNFNYTNNYTKSFITCPVNNHGDFLMSPNNHLRNHGCSKCKEEKSSKILKSNSFDFIKKAIAIHGDTYDYSKVNYNGIYEKVTIICKKHGEFLQSPNNHLKCNGCPRCKSSKGELALEEIFKKYNITYEPQYRIPIVVDILKYDFYLPDYNLLIEFHGKQHYEWITYFHKTEDDFLKQKDRDDIIRYNARRWKYRYLEFNYKQLKHLSKEKFEELIIDEINKFKKKG